MEWGSALFPFFSYFSCWLFAQLYWTNLVLNKLFVPPMACSPWACHQSCLTPLLEPCWEACHQGLPHSTTGALLRNTCQKVAVWFMQGISCFYQLVLVYFILALSELHSPLPLSTCVLFRERELGHKSTAISLLMVTSFVHDSWGGSVYQIVGHMP